VPIAEILWPQDRIAHIARHGVAPEEFEEVCFGASLVLRGKATGPNPVYYVLGETDTGRRLFCLVIEFPDRKGYPVTAREMTTNERRRYTAWKAG
jgi:uncharacterized DUF497 family protein